MSYQKVLTIQDISCVGQCSMTVAMPILSACGLETAILPSSVLSTHTGGFTGYTVRDLTEDFPAIREHWEREGILFDAAVTGYLGSTRQIDYVADIFRSRIVPGGRIIVDPAMADNGRLYPGFDAEYAAAMGRLCALADAIVPNITEACILTGTPYAETYDEAYVEELVKKLATLGAKYVVLTGVSYDPQTTGVVVWDGESSRYYSHRKITKSYHGTGDIYTAALAGAWIRGRELFEAAGIAAEYTVSCIEKTVSDPNHWYGVKFELAIPELVEALKE